jgi:osmotically inducible protein OsmC
MAVRQATAVWNGNLKDGKGRVKIGSGAFEGQYSFQSRFEEGTGTNPEELIAGAHSACYSMALSHGLAGAGFTPTSVTTTAKVHLVKSDAGFEINLIELDCNAVVPGIDNDTFQKQAEGAKVGCPISRVLAATRITINAKLAG